MSSRRRSSRRCHLALPPDEALPLHRSVRRRPLRKRPGGGAGEFQKLDLELGRVVEVERRHKQRLDRCGIGSAPVVLQARDMFGAVAGSDSQLALREAGTAPEIVQARAEADEVEGDCRWRS